MPHRRREATTSVEASGGNFALHSRPLRVRHGVAAAEAAALHFDDGVGRRRDRAPAPGRRRPRRDRGSRSGSTQSSAICAGRRRFVRRGLNGCPAAGHERRRRDDSTRSTAGRAPPHSYAPLAHHSAELVPSSSCRSASGGPRAQHATGPAADVQVLGCQAVAADRGSA